jgi:hypothetical protein
MWTVLVGKPKGKGPFRKLRHRCKDRIRMDPGRDQIRRGQMQSEFSWLSTGTNDGLLWIQPWTFRFWQHSYWVKWYLKVIPQKDNNEDSRTMTWREKISSIITTILHIKGVCDNIILSTPLHHNYWWKTLSYTFCQSPNCSLPIKFHYYNLWHTYHLPYLCYMFHRKHNGTKLKGRKQIKHNRKVNMMLFSST